MNRMELESNSDVCVEYLGDTGVAMKNAASLGEYDIADQHTRS